MSSISVGLVSTGHNESTWNGSTYVDKWFSGANSAGGVSVRFTVRNLSGKQIKYLRFSLKPFNRVNDFVSSEISHQNTSVFSYTGPLYPNNSADLFWENAWYNNTIVGAIIESVEIEYMDGTMEQISGNNITVDKYLGATPPIVTAISIVAMIGLTIFAVMWFMGYV